MAMANLSGRKNKSRRKEKKKKTDGGRASGSAAPAYITFHWRISIHCPLGHGGIGFSEEDGSAP